MKKEDFFEVLGELDDDVVKGAEKPVKKRLDRKVWRMIAACFMVSLFIGIFAISLQWNDGTVSELETNDPKTTDTPPVLYADDDAVSESEKDESELNDPESDDSIPGDLPPMVYVNDTLYIQSGDQERYLKLEDEFVYLGQIVSDIPSSTDAITDGVPKENFQANTPIVGSEVYQYGENIVVKINDVYYLFVKLR